MSGKGICTVCQAERWITIGKRVCRPCSYPVGECVGCNYRGKIYVQGLCYCCYQHQQVRIKLDLIEASFRPMSPYNHELFGLYLSYIKRYRLASFHAKQAATLAEILAEDAWPTINCWNDVYTLSDKYQLNHPNGKPSGCAAFKIAYMLEELKVLPPNEDDCSKQIARKLTQLTRLNIGSEATDIASWLKKSGRRESTILNNLTYIHSFFEWGAGSYPKLDLKRSHHAKIIEFMKHLASQGYAVSQQRSHLLALRRFFSRLCYHKTIQENPCIGITTNKILEKINIISEADLKNLYAYVKSESSPVEEALYITLILFFALKTEDLLRATIDVSPTKRLKIILHESPRSYGKHHYNRKQILELPQNPDWLKSLQTRFIETWQQNYAKTKQSYPCPRLVLPRNHHYTRPLHPKTLLKRIYAATVDATGRKITPNVLRQTCGHLHTRNGDGSALTTLGWSPSFAFHYTWLPRHITTD